MEFLKKHYEKLILSVVLLGLAAVAATLPMKVNEEKQKEEDRKNSLIGAKVEPLKSVDLTTNQTVLAKVKTPIHFDVAGKHNLFNPVPWVEKQGGELQKVPGGGAAGMAALEVTAVSPLQMIVSFDEVVPTAGAGGTNEFKYTVTVIREGATTSPKQSRTMNKGMTAGGIGTLKDVVGPPEAPTSLVVTMPDRTDITITKEKPFTRIIGYAADLYNGITQPPYTQKAAKVGTRIAFGSDAYTITLIDTNGVVLRDVKTQKQFTKPVANPK